MAQIRQSDVQNPHFSLPFRFGGIHGAAIVNEQDATEDIVDCVKAILAYPIGSNEALPGFGIPDIVFRVQSSKNIASGVAKSVRQWEPRSDAFVTEYPIAFDELVRKLIIRVRGEN
jgi:phage baseplate assembly protein W